MKQPCFLEDGRKIKSVAAKFRKVDFKALFVRLQKYNILRTSDYLYRVCLPGVGGIIIDLYKDEVCLGQTYQTLPGAINTVTNMLNKIENESRKDL